MAWRATADRIGFTAKPRWWCVASLLFVSGGAACGSGGGDDTGSGGASACGVEGAQESCYPGAAATRGIGRCADGTRTCAAGIWSECQGYRLPEAEICDDLLDQDCNGSADDGCPCAASESRACYGGPPSTRGIGECRDGIQQCIDGQWAADCAGDVMPLAEACNGRDDDCDGVTDPGCACTDGETMACYDGPAGTEDVGSCHGGQRVCAAGAWSASCQGEVTPEPESCNDQDDDCDGSVDGLSEPCYTGPAGTEYVGTCHGGQHTCQHGQWPAACSGQVTPAAEQCNRDDDDCDGVVDTPSCLGTIYRFYNPTTNHHMYKLDDPSPEPGFTAETFSTFRVYLSHVAGTTQLYVKSNGSDYMLTTTPSEADALGYTVWSYAGFVGLSSFPAAGFDTTTLCRYHYTPNNDHMVWPHLAPADLPPDWVEDFCAWYVWDFV